jgi:hypothetical protein
LIRPLSDYSERILQESNDDQEAANGGQVPAGLQSADIVRSLCFYFYFFVCFQHASTHGLTGSANESNRSSILLV